MIKSEKFTLAGAAGQMEGVIDTPEQAPRGIALVAHPHPLFGGTMDNKVAVTLMRTFVGLGYVVARILAFTHVHAEKYVVLVIRLFVHGVLVEKEWQHGCAMIRLTAD